MIAGMRMNFQWRIIDVLQHTTELIKPRQSNSRTFYPK
jgi:hypothetical protein